MPLIFILNKIRISCFSKFKSHLLKKHDVNNLCLQASLVSPTFASVATFLCAYNNKEFSRYPLERYDKFGERQELFKTDIKKRFNIEFKGEQPSSLVGSIGHQEVKFEMEKLKETIYRNLAMASDMEKAKIAISHSPILDKRNKDLNSVKHSLDEAYSDRVGVAYKASLELQSHSLLAVAYGCIKDGRHLI